MFSLPYQVPLGGRICSFLFLDLCQFLDRVPLRVDYSSCDPLLVMGFPAKSMLYEV